MTADTPMLRELLSKLELPPQMLQRRTRQSEDSNSKYLYRVGLQKCRLVLMIMSWKVPPGQMADTAAASAQAGPRNSDKKAQQNLATHMQPRSVNGLPI